MSLGPSRSREEYNRRQARVFDRDVRYFEQAIPEDALDRLRVVVEMAGLEPGCAVLDAGTGVGVLLPFILEKSPAEVVACDLSDKMLDVARGRFGDRACFLKRDVTTLSAAETTFDAVFCNACFANFYDQRATVLAISKLLRPGGRLIISHPMGRDFVLGLKERSPEFELRDLPDSREAAGSLLEPAGLRIVHYQDDPLLYLVVARKEKGAVRGPGA